MGGKKGKRRERNQDWTCAPKKRAVKGGKVLHLGSPLMDREISLERGSFGALEESTEISVRKEKQRVTCIDSWHHCPALSRLRRLSASRGGDWMLKLRI